LRPPGFIEYAFLIDHAEEDDRSCAENQQNSKQKSACLLRPKGFELVVQPEADATSEQGDRINGNSKGEIPILEQVAVG
jgi:hypothetical protein